MRCFVIALFLFLSSTVSAWRLLVTGQTHAETHLQTFQHNLFSTIHPPALRREDVCDRGFSNFEGWAEKPENNRRVILEPISFDALERLTAEGISVWSLANNHAFDGEEEGIEGTQEAMERVHATFAGTGHDANSAANFAMLPCAKVPTAFLALASGGVDATVADRAQATDDRVGVNMLTLTEQDEPNPVELARILNAVRAARRAVGPNGVVLFSHHNHLFFWNQTFTPLYRLRDPRATEVPAWMPGFVEQVLDAGASIYLGHGNPLFQGLSIVKGKPVFYGLGNLVFHVTQSNDQTYGLPAYEGIASDIRIVGKDQFHIRVKPLALTPDRSNPNWGLPFIPNASHAQTILNRFVNLSAAFGTRLEVDAESAVATLQLKIPEEKIPKAPAAKKKSRAPAAIGAGAAVLLVLVGGAGLRRRQRLAKATATPPQEVAVSSASVDLVSIRV